MRKFFGGLALLMAMFLLTFGAQAQNKYVGTKTCIMCHKGAAKGAMDEIWMKSKHANAYTVLTEAKALEIAKAKGIANPAESKECNECHTLGKTVDASLFDAKFDIKQGVQCETCHGAGSAYKSSTVMKNKEEAIKNGLNAFDGGVEKFCRGCHNEKSPTFKEFKFAEMFDKIKHKKP